MINLRGAPLLRPFLIFGFLGLALVDAFSRINGYKNHWRDIWVGWLIGFAIALFLVSLSIHPVDNSLPFQCYCVLCFQEVYHVVVAKTPLPPAVTQVEERVSPFFSWFRLPRISAPSVKEEYV